SGESIPTADKLAKIAGALDIHAFEVDGYRFTITRKERVAPVRPGEQLTLDFSGEYAFSKATVRLSPGRINISFDGVTPISAEEAESFSSPFSSLMRTARERSSANWATREMAALRSSPFTVMLLLLSLGRTAS